jgi:hypothetical protein
MFKVLNNGEIELTRGDSATLTVNITDGVGEPYTVRNEDTLTLSLKKDVKDPKPCVQKSINGNNVIHLEPKDTAGLDFGNYVYDVELLTAEGDVYTVIEKTVFKLREEVTTR